MGGVEHVRRITMYNIYDDDCSRCAYYYWSLFPVSAIAKTGRHVPVPSHIPVGRHGTGNRRERNGGAQTGRRILRAHHRVRRTAGVRVFRIVNFRLRPAVRPVDCRYRRAGSHIPQAPEQVSAVCKYIILLLLGL